MLTERKTKKKIICVKNAFHGRTYAAISASGQSRMLEEFLPALNGFEQVEFNNIDAIKKKIDNKTAGILIETIQGEGGITPANKKYLRDLNDIAKERSTSFLMKFSAVLDVRVNF